ncbi:SDR family NAD(P)-dependent oxidoreductase [Cumulibacter soli]|uniref:SDR family NAD(P)-dependent oxidoreductase n=1 Tax=Cumulibacter soli TaxID=2546344 RepID=UPI001067D0D7|nr:SDR family oxidoreductase [Cumulibacter soli]
MGKLDGRIAVVTGAAQGIGLAVAKDFVAHGAKVALVDANEQIGDIAAKLGDSARGFVGDVSNRGDMRQVLLETNDLWGPLSVLVANAGITRPAMMWKMTDEQWDAVLNVHLKGSWICTQEALTYMREQRFGRLIYVTSSAGINGTIGQCNYAAAKGGILALMRSAAKELADIGITANAVSPAAATPMTEVIRTDERFKDVYRDRIPMKRWAEPEEISPTFSFLASDESSYMTGQTLTVDGGSVPVR